MATDVTVPALGESITEGTLAQWLKKPGEQVAADEAIATLETDKVSVDVPSPSAGVLTETLVNEGDTVAKDSSYGEVESVKAVSEVIAPLSGEVIEVNRKVVDEPETVNADPYGEGWLIRIRLTEPSEADALLDVAAYKQGVAES